MSGEGLKAEGGPAAKKTRTNEKAEEAEPKVEDGKFYIQWSMKQNLGYGADENTLDMFANHYTGTLIQRVEKEHDSEGQGYGWDEDDRYEKRVAGSVSLWRIKSNNIVNNGMGMIECLDPISQELADVAILLQTLEGVDDSSPIDMRSDPMTALFMHGRAEGSIPKTLVNEVGDGCEITQGETVYIEKLVVRKEFRGHGLGLFMLDAAANVINGHMSLTLINPFPLQYENESFRNGSRPQDYPVVGSIEDDRRKLEAYYRKLGFKKLGGKMLGMWNGYSQPELLNAAPSLVPLLL